MKSVEQATEKIARRISKDRTGSESLWELFLTDAYREYYDLEFSKKQGSSNA